MTSPSGPQKGRPDPNSLAHQVAERLAATGDDARRAHRRRQRFSLFGVGIGLLTVAAGTVLLVIGAVAWLVRTPVNLGAAASASPLISCDSGVQANMIGAGDSVEVIGVSEDGAWLVINDPGGGPRMYVDVMAIEVEDLTVGHADCEALDQPGDGNSTPEGVLAAPPPNKGPRGGTTSTLFAFVTTTLGSPAGPTTSFPGVTFPGLTTTTTSPATTTTTTGSPTTTKPTTTTTRPPTTTTHGTTTTSTSTSTTSTTSTSTSTSTTSTSTSTTSTTIDPSTTTTEPSTSTTLP